MTVKETVFYHLQNPQTDNGFISGQELADRCHVSRTAVWKAINSLKQSGCCIEAVSNKGYRLLAQNVFDKQSIQKLTDSNLKVNVVFHTQLDSTNLEAKRLCATSLSQTKQNEEENTVIVASSQTNGRGRLGRSFYSPDQTGIYLSIIYNDNNIKDASSITASTAVAIVRAINKVYGIQSQIKWINDIYINGKKVAGVLTEGITDFETGRIETAIIGIGINITLQQDLPEELKQKAGSILEQTTDYKRSELCATVINEVLYILKGSLEEKQKAMTEYSQYSLLIGKEVRVTPVIDSDLQSYDCTVLGITEDAKLKVQKQDGSIVLLNSGEVTLHNSDTFF